MMLMTQADPKVSTLEIQLLFCMWTAQKDAWFWGPPWNPSGVRSHLGTGPMWGGPVYLLAIAKDMRS